MTVSDELVRDALSAFNSVRGGNSNGAAKMRAAILAILPAIRAELKGELAEAEGFYARWKQAVEAGNFVIAERDKAVEGLTRISNIKHEPDEASGEWRFALQQSIARATLAELEKTNV